MILSRDRGKPWRLERGGGNKYKQVELSSKDTAEFYFKNLIAPPSSSLACLDFRFKKFSSGSNQSFVFFQSKQSFPRREQQPASCAGLALQGEAGQGEHRPGEPRPRHLGPGPGHLQERGPGLPPDVQSSGPEGRGRQPHPRRGQGRGDRGPVPGAVTPHIDHHHKLP